MSTFKKLLGDTAIYGVSSIIGRFLNWWLVPYHTGIFNPSEYGIVSNLYSYVAFFIILLTYGMETGFFRFASKSENYDRVYSTSLISLFTTSLLFVLVIRIFRDNIATALQYPDHAEFIWWLALTVSLDAVTAIPFARLRLQGRPVKFAFIKIINIFLNIGFNLVFLSLFPWIVKNDPGFFLVKFYDPGIGVGYVFISNMLASFFTLVLLYREILFIRLSFDKHLLKGMLIYSFPILVIGLAGMINQNIDKILIPFLMPQEQNPMFQLGIYGASYKLAVLMNMFIQAFRYAFEPFFFSKSASESKENPKMYAMVMKYFIIFGLIIFLGMVLFIDIIKLLIPGQYHEGIKVVPIILMADLFFGVFFSASIWYKIKDRTMYGAYIALMGAAITLVMNILLIPVYGYMGSAVAVFVCYLFMMVINYFWGQKFYPIPYNLKKIAGYFIFCLTLFAVSFFFADFPPLTKYVCNSILLIGFLLFVLKMEKSELMQLLLSKKRIK